MSSPNLPLSVGGIASEIAKHKKDRRMTSKVERDWGTGKTALGAFRIGIKDTSLNRIGLWPVFVRRLLPISRAYRVGKGSDTLLFDTARDTIRMFRHSFERSQAFRIQSLTITWDAAAYDMVARELASEMANSVVVEEAVFKQLQEARWARFTDTSLTGDDPHFFIAPNEATNVVALNIDDDVTEHLKWEPLVCTFNRTLDLIDEDGLARRFREVRNEVVALARVGQAMFGSHY